MEKVIRDLEEKQKYVNNPKLRNSIKSKIDILKGNKIVKK